MSRLFSSVIFAGHNVGSGVPITLDPAFVWVLRDIEFFFPGVGLLGNAAIIDVATSATLLYFSASEIGPNGAHQQWQGRIVLVPPESGPALLVNGSGDGGNPDIRISGYKLTP